MAKNLSPRTYEGQFNVQAYGAKGDGSNDDTAEVQAALDAAYAAGGGIVRFPPGTYNRSDTWVIKDNVHIRCDSGVTIKRTNDAFGYLLQNGTSGVAKSGYAGHSNISVHGGIWDMQGATLTTDAAAFAFGHATNIEFQDVTIKDVPDDHAMDLTALKGVRIKNCRFTGYRVGAGTQVNIEAIQIDYAGTSHFPPFGSEDNTPCDDVLIEGCYFGPSGTAGTASWSNGIGNHDSVAGSEHTNIVIRNNYFDTITNYAIHPYGYQRMVIEGNTFVSCGSGIHLVTATSQSIRDVVISNNNFQNMTSIQHPISLQPVSGTTLTGVTIANNNIDTTASGSNDRGIYMIRCDDVAITGNTINSTSDSGIVVNTANRVSINGNTINSTAGRGIDCGTCVNVAVSGNSIRSTTLKGIYFSSCTDGAITGNTVQLAGEAGIQLSGGSRNTIAGNQIYESQQQGILLTGSSSQNLISGNQVIGASRQTAATYGAIELNNAANNENSIVGNKFHKYGSGNEAPNPIVFKGNLALSNYVSKSNDFGDDWSTVWSSNITLNGATVRTDENVIAVPFHVPGALTTGVKTPEFIAPVSCTVIALYARVNSGSGSAVRPSKNGGTTDGSILASIATSSLNTIQSVSLAAGDRLGINVTTAGTGSDLSVTFWVSLA